VAQMSQILLNIRPSNVYLLQPTTTTTTDYISSIVDYRSMMALYDRLATLTLWRHCDVTHHFVTSRPVHRLVCRQHRWRHDCCRSCCRQLRFT